jgi:hypothetical protein
VQAVRAGGYPSPLVATLGLLAAAVAGLVLGPAACLAAGLPVALVAYSLLLADLDALIGPGPALARANAELLAANATVRWQVVRDGGAILRDATAGGLPDARAPAILAAAFLSRHAGPAEALLDELAPTAAW